MDNKKHMTFIEAMQETIKSLNSFADAFGHVEETRSQRIFRETHQAVYLIARTFFTWLFLLPVAIVKAVRDAAIATWED